jgi:hypothetical protein
VPSSRHSHCRQHEARDKSAEQQLTGLQTLVGLVKAQFHAATLLIRRLGIDDDFTYGNVSQNVQQKIFGCDLTPTVS